MLNGSLLAWKFIFVLHKPRPRLIFLGKVRNTQKYILKNSSIRQNNLTFVWFSLYYILNRFIQFKSKRKATQTYLQFEYNACWESSLFDKLRMIWVRCIQLVFLFTFSCGYDERQIFSIYFFIFAEIWFSKHRMQL